ncbi:serine peptidase, clan SB, family S8-like protein [Trypanosoma equiperdum]|uniref:Serine peptidase, clan SB, family S8-like protein n=1 Tax=Trypanosoma equiperdum TaxID=5694 RepID=A0A1G4I8C2_TRYEQ|nr:serine peptidase, clan SB, family S8-like protein [Trypanosoma equiperdum]
MTCIKENITGLLFLCCCLSLSLWVLSTCKAHADGETAEPNTSCSYMLMLDCLLHPEATEVATRRLQKTNRWKWWRSGLPSGSEVHVHPPPAPSGTWNDFLLMDIRSPLCGKLSGNVMESEISGTSFALPTVGRVIVLRVVEDRWVPKEFTRTHSIESRGDKLSRWRYPRQYLRLRTALRWSGLGVRVAVLDNGVDAALLPQRDVEGIPNSAGEKSDWSVALCRSFVPDVPCENRRDSHGTFSVSVTAGNISLTSNLRSNEGFGNQTTSFTDASTAEEMPAVSKHYVGVAPGSTVGMFRVFDDARGSKTSWLVSALNDVLQWRADVVSLAFGGTDNMDTIFTEKIRVLAMSGVVVVAAAGNDGPTMGTIHNPADQAEVLAVGSLGTVNCHIVANAMTAHPGHDDREGNCTDSRDQRWVSQFSGRGPSTVEFPFGAGRVRPDILALGEHVVGVGCVMEKFGMSGEERVLGLQVSHGTSVATALVAGVAALCIEALRTLGDGTRVNVALVKGLLIETAVELVPNTESLNSVERVLMQERKKYSSQGAGSWSTEGDAFLNGKRRRTLDGVDMVHTLFHYRNVLQFSRLSQGGGEVCPTCALSRIEQRAHEYDRLLEVFAFPKAVDATGDHHLPHGGKGPAAATLGPCLLNWPYCEQPLFPSAAPIAFNLSLHNARCESSRLNLISPNVTISGAEGFCSANRVCEPGYLGAEIAQQLVLVRADASLVMSAHSGWLSLFALSPANASTTQIPPPTSAAESNSPDSFALDRYDLITVIGSVRLAYLCTASGEHQKANADVDESGGVRSVTVPFKLPVVRRPSRLERVGFDMSHQWFYPPGQVPDDDIRQERHVLHYRRGNGRLRGHAVRSRSGEKRCGAYECESDHLYTNMALFFLYLRRVLGLFVEQPLLTYLPFGVSKINGVGGVNAKRDVKNVSVAALKRYYGNIGTLILFDLELPLLRMERTLISDAVRYEKLHLLVVSEWFSRSIARGTSSHSSTPGGSLFPSLKGNQNVNSSFCDADEPKVKSNGCLPKEPMVLDGSSHVPSLNALLRDVSHGKLQLDTEHVVSGELVLATCPHHSYKMPSSFWSISSWFSWLWFGGAQRADGCVDRHLGEIQSAGVVLWPPTGERNKQGDESHSELGGERSSADSKPTAVCSVAKNWARGLYFHSKLKDSGGNLNCDDATNGCGDGTKQREVDVMHPVGQSAFVPIFGFVGSGGDCLGEDGLFDNEGCMKGAPAAESLRHAGGRVVLFTDSNSFSDLPHSAATLHRLNLLIYDTSRLLSRSSTETSFAIDISHKIEAIVREESFQPSLSLGLIGDFVSFLHNGGTKNFMQGVDCRRSDGTSLGHHWNDISTSEKAENGGRDGLHAANEEDKASLLALRLFQGAPQRVAIAERVRAVLVDWEAAIASEADYAETDAVITDGDCNGSFFVQTADSRKLWSNCTYGGEGVNMILWTHILGLTFTTLVLYATNCLRCLLENMKVVAVEPSE